LTTRTLPNGTDVESCGLVGRIVVADSNRGVGAAIPRRGEVVAAYADGPSFSGWLRIAVDTDGMVTLESEVLADGSDTLPGPGDQSSSSDPASAGMGASVVAGPSASAPAGAIDACSDSYYKLTGGHWSGNDPVVRYRVNTASIPTYMYVSNVTTALYQGIDRMVRGDTPCVSHGSWVGGSAPIGAEYLGSTTAGAGIGDAARCLGRDNKNVVVFGTLPYETNAFACWYSSTLIDEVDMKFNDANRWDATVSNDGCQNEYDLRSIATHEAGHWVGLADVYDVSHWNLTMYGYSNTCETRQYSPALGDYKGLKWIYNP
jgi:hypothetical protein